MFTNSDTSGSQRTSHTLVLLHALSNRKAEFKPFYSEAPLTTAPPAPHPQTHHCAFIKTEEMLFIAPAAVCWSENRKCILTAVAI